MRKRIQKKELLEIVHTLPGRVRFQFKPERVGIPDLDDFLKIPGVREAIFNKITNTLLIIYDRKKLNLEKLISEIRKRIPSLEISKTRLQKEKELAILPSDDLLSDLIYKSVIGFNRNINLKTKGRADLTSLIPSGLILGGLAELIRNPVMPHWYDMWWFAYNILWQNYTHREGRKQRNY